MRIHRRPRHDFLGEARADSWPRLSERPASAGRKTESASGWWEPLRGFSRRGRRRHPAGIQERTRDKIRGVEIQRGLLRYPQLHHEEFRPQRESQGKIPGSRTTASPPRTQPGRIRLPAAPEAHRRAKAPECESGDSAWRVLAVRFFAEYALRPPARRSRRKPSRKPPKYCHSAARTPISSRCFIKSNGS
jgi:hypothetical protein